MNNAMGEPNCRFSYMLQAAYMYYFEDINLMTDSEYDKEVIWVRDNWDSIDHPLKKLIDVETLKESTSLFYIRECDIPYGFLRYAYKWAHVLGLYEYKKPNSKQRKL